MVEDEESILREELARLWRETEPTVAAYVFAAVSQFQEAEDIVQQVALTVARRFSEYDRERSFVAWTLWIAKSRIIDFYRKRDREKRFFSDHLLEKLADTFSSSSIVPNEKRVALEKCIDRLPEKSRQMLQLRYADGKKIGQVASVLQKSAGVIRMTLYRIRNLLADCVRIETAKESM
jgi:RNA polymerase sigma-70 factor, ECF subfamily